MAWTFRVVRTTLADGGIRYALHDVVYDSEDRDLPVFELEKSGMSWTEDPVGPEYYVFPGEKDDPSSAVQALRQELMEMFKTTTWPIVNGDTESGEPLIPAVALSP